VLSLNKHSNCTHTDQHRTCFTLFFAIIFSSFCVFAQSLQEVKLTANDGQSGDTFGFAVAISGDDAFAGANEVNVAKGAVYVFHRDETGWQYLTKLVPADIAPTGYFGFSVAVDGDFAVVGARNYRRAGG